MMHFSRNTLVLACVSLNAACGYESLESSDSLDSSVEVETFEFGDDALVAPEHPASKNKPNAPHDLAEAPEFEDVSERTIYDLGEEPELPPCDGGQQQALQALWQCLNALGGLSNNGTINTIAELSGIASSHLGCELPEGYFVEPPEWTNDLPGIAQGTALTQCLANLPAALGVLLLEHLGDVGIPPEVHWDSGATGAECFADGQPGTWQLTVLGNRCIPNGGGAPAMCMRPPPPSCAANTTMPAFDNEDDIDAYCATVPVNTLFTWVQPATCTDSIGTTHFDKCSPRPCW